MEAVAADLRVVGTGEQAHRRHRRRHRHRRQLSGAVPEQEGLRQLGQVLQVVVREGQQVAGRRRGAGGAKVGAPVRNAEP
jgi:hypothetical protein